MSSPPRDNEPEGAPQPHDSPSRSIGGIATLSAPEPAPLSPSGHHDDALGGAQNTPQEQRAIAGIFDDDGDDDGDVSGALPSVPRHSGDAGDGNASRAAAEEEDEEEDDDDEERRRRRRRREALEDEEAEAAQRRKKSRKQRDQEGRAAGAEGEEEEDEEEAGNGLPQMTEQELRRAVVDAQIDAAIKSGRKKQKRRRKEGEEDLDPQADAEVAELRSAMMNAAEDDVMANEERKPALAKLRMLPRVVDGLQKQHWQQSIFDSNLLEAVRRFLEPLPDKSLPALNIQRELFKALEKLSPSIDTISLKMSGLGKVVMFYSRNRRVEADLRRRADRLIEAWSRPILKRSASYRAIEIPKSGNYYAGGGLSQSQASTLLALSQDPSADIDPKRRNVSIPQPVSGGYKVAPRSYIDPSMAGGEGGDAAVRSAIASRERLNAFKRKVKEAKK
ncbi:unnamed protein product [Parajaminaea phylloscopi]